ncbi:O-antigen ligase family protein [Chloroflexus sp.]|uniref:O-antigen ligase family protein n=1 Tax=Chloroflexus sp. TaxID=1904827 RepID=UPI002ADE4D99|nr:O-antigen ligase family protein [Chloroflexus sp.]
MSKKSLRHSIEFAFHVLAFILLSGAFVTLWRNKTLGNIDPVEGDPVQRLLLGLAYMGIGLLVFHPRRAGQLGRKGWLLWALVGWALLSTLWSAAPEITLRRSLAAVLGLLYGLLLAVRYRPEEVLRMLGTALAIVVVASLIAVVMVPDWAIMGFPHEGAWQGVLYHKNALGRLCALALAVFWVLARAERSCRSVFWRVAMLIAGILVLGSRSATGLILALALPAGWWLLRAWSRLPGLLRPAAGSLAMAVFIPGLLVLPNIVESVLEFLGRDLTLTGRTPLWLASIPLALERPLLGYGYGAFWLGERGPSAAVWAVTWDASHAHNGYLDLWLELGLIGAGLAFVLVVLTMVRYASAALQFKDIPIISFGFLVSLLIFVINMSEAILLESGLAKAFYWVLFAYVYLLTLQKPARMNDNEP